MGAGLSPAQQGELRGAAVDEPDLARARAALRAGRCRLALIGPAPGVELVRELVQGGCAVPLVLVHAGGEEGLADAALLAGAASCLDLSRLRPGELGRSLLFLCACRARAEQRSAQLQQDLANYLAHEGKNALAGVRGAVQVVRDHLPLEAPDRLLCAEVLERLVALTRTLESLTALLRPVTPAVRNPVPLGGLLRAALERLAPPGGPRITTRAEEVEVGGDREQLALLLEVVLRGALEAAGTGGQVQVDLRPLDGAARLEVTDSGAAPRPEELHRLLQPFGAPSGVRAGPGLPLARRLAEQHGGSLELGCTSSGFSVRVRLPC